MANGLLDFIGSPEGQGLLSAVAGGMAGARRGTPFNNVGRGLLAGVAGYGNAQDRQAQEQERALMEQDRQQTRAMRDMQMGQMRTQLEQQQAQQAWRAGLPDVQKQATTATYGAGEEGPTMTPPNPNALLEYAMKPGSPFADELLRQKVIPKQPEAFTLSPGQTRFEGGRQVASLPDQAKKTAIEEMLDAAGITDPGIRQSFILQGLKKQTTHAPAASTNVTLKQEGEEAKSVGKFFGDAYANIQQAGFSAQSKVNRYSRLGQLLDGVSTGKFAGAGLEVAKAASSLGFNIDPNMANKEAAQALSGEIALELRNPSGGAGMPGAMSDADRQFLTNMVPGLATTPEGRTLMLETAQKLAKRDMDVARMARDYRKRNGSINEGFYDELARYSESNPLFHQQAPQAPASGFSIRRVR